MWACVVCRCRIELDDVVLIRRPGGCICLSCYARETGTARPVPTALRRQVVAVLDKRGAP